jgi:CRISPR-associated protein Csm3
MTKLIGKILIEGTIQTITGLHIGGSKTALEIGGVDLNVVKTPGGQPFIPGSSLKGKMRSLVALSKGSWALEDDPAAVQELFGSAEVRRDLLTRLYVRDAHLNLSHFEAQKHFENHQMEFAYSDVKWENRIDRKKGTARDPRQLERVPAGTAFNFGFVYNLFDDHNLPVEDSKINRLKEHLDTIITAMRLLQDDYLGGQGSRGYGQVAFKEVQATLKLIGDDQYGAQAGLTDNAANQTYQLFLNNLKTLPEHASRHTEMQAR